VTFSETAHYSGFDTAHTVTINPDTGFAYAAGSDTCDGGLHMVNIQNPTAPTFAGCYSGDGYTHETQCVIYHGPDVQHQGKEICFASNEDTLTIVDVTNKSAPVQLSRTSYPRSGYTHQGWLTENHRYFVLDDELDEEIYGHNTLTRFFSVADLDAPTLRFSLCEGRFRLSGQLPGRPAYS
jgi:choice-of-anchor B domain-containing protein